MAILFPLVGPLAASVSAGSIGPIFGLADEIATSDFSNRPLRRK